MSHFNYCRRGVGCLSMSKRIINKVFSCAYDCSIEIYYQDTGSIHLNYDDVYKVVKLYTDKCNQDLVCKYLGNFHSDFKIADACKDAEIYSVDRLLLGKTHTYICYNQPVNMVTQ